ncbi:BNA7 [Candida pseudojiufengensis]|uniref:BNA7 n=1 Tax=Candida pseudojiufengensis TaxID=497109 RepID=UPI002224CA9F|nr:BNA7 [Candida pseudojiufengensis]KAI5962162.1 BNA7 [Candida pseudojiufengensis]
MSVYEYGDHELQKIKVWNYSDNNENTFIYIHGGAWRDPNNTYDELKTVAENNPQATFIGINYRLSPEVKHPDHYLDVYTALSYIHFNYKYKKIHLMGYSVGATICLQLIQHLHDRKSPIHFNSIKFLDGIYDIEELLNEYPSYISFVNDAFSKLDEADESINLLKKPNIDKNTSIIIVQSLQDELLSMSQTKLLIDYFVIWDIGFTLLTGNWGKHDDIYGAHRSEIFMKV